MENASENTTWNTRRGFTLVELIVSIGIFAVVITMCISTLLVMVDANRKAQALQSAMTNLSFVTDSITRNIRTGYDYYCRDSGNISTLPSAGTTQDCLHGENIVFTSELTSERIGYRKNGNVLERRVGNGSWLEITSDDVSVTDFDITVENSDDFYGDGDQKQPKVTMRIEGTVFSGLEAETDFNLQTDVIQRVLDY